MSETSGAHLIQTPESQIVDSLGFVTPNNALRVVDENGNNLGPNQPGELYVKQPILLLGYLKDPEKTKKLVDEDGWVHTGDMVSYNENGEYIFHDRMSEIIKFRGILVSPNELRFHLLKQPDILEVAIVPVPHPLDGEWPMAFIQKFPGSKVRLKFYEN